jgi:4-amino-4-deoxy-L-arabinose transferase-like glycosyltransferase
MPSDARRLGLIILVALALRLVVFPGNEHLYGDAVSRTEMAEDWARAPHLIRSFGDGAAQYGPLHIYLVGAALSVFDRNDASRFVSLLFGVLTLIPIFALTRHYFGTASATWAGLAFACWGLHIQASTTGGSEAVALFLLWVAFAWLARAFYRPHWIAFATAALAMNLAAATRYDAWMYIPLLAVVPLWQWPDKARAIRLGLLFLILCLPYPVFWMVGNAAAHGDPLYPLTYIDEFHRVWALESGGGWQAWWLRVQGLGFWPAMAIFTLSPGVAVLGLIGMASAWRMRPASRWLIVAAAVPTAYYAFRTAVLLDFVPLGRFTVVQVSLLLPFIVTGWSWVLAQRGRTDARRVAMISGALAVLMPLTLGAFTFRNDSVAATVLKPLSPTSTNPRALMRAAAFVRTTVVERGRTLALDEDATYQDLQLAFFARVSPERTTRLRWPGFRERVVSSPPDFVVVFSRGRLLAEPWVSYREGVLMLGTERYAEITSRLAPAAPTAPPSPSSSPIRLFERQSRTIPPS